MAARTGGVALLVAVAVVAPREAQASDKLDTSLDLSLHGVFAVLDVDGLRLRPSGDEPSELKGLDARLLGRTTLMGFHQRVGMNLHGVRFGVGVGTLAAPTLRVRHDRRDLAVNADSAWAIPLDGYLSFAPGDPRWFRPYGGVTGGATLLSTTLESGSPGVPYRAFTWGLSARAGVVLEINQYFFADLGGSLGLLGADVFQLSAALGVPIPLANL